MSDLDSVQGASVSRVNDNLFPRINLKVKKMAHFKGDLPGYQSRLASGFDITAQIDASWVLAPGERRAIPTGLIFEIPAGFEIQVRPRSGLAAKLGLTVLNSPGTIDADYRGEVKVLIVNLGQESLKIQPGERVAQLVLAPVVQAQLQWADELTTTERGKGGFGSTGL